MDKLKSTLRQFVRDWSSEGARERADSYLPLITELKRLKPINIDNQERMKVVVPGAGLARLGLKRKK